MTGLDTIRAWEVLAPTLPLWPLSLSSSSSSADFGWTLSSSLPSDHARTPPSAVSEHLNFNITAVAIYGFGGFGSGVWVSCPFASPESGFASLRHAQTVLKSG